MALGTPQDHEGAVKPSSIEKDVYDGESFAMRITEIPSNLKARYAYDGSNNCIYAGYAPKGMAEGTDGWLLVKYTYDVSNNCTEKNIAYGNWTARAGYTFN